MHRSVQTLAKIVFFAAFLITTQASLAAAQTTIRVGVRPDAKPFSYKPAPGQENRNDAIPGPLRNEGYDGYMVHMCDSALITIQSDSRLDFKVKVVEVAASSRIGMLRDGKIDILCDPATITPERIDGLLASVPVYLSGITYASQREAPRYPCKSLVGVVGRTTSAMGGVESILAAGEWPTFKDILRGSMRDSEAWKEAKPPCIDENDADAKRDFPIREFDTHSQAVEAFCNKEIMYYVGDVEIVASSLGDKPECKYEDAIETFTEERYAIYARDQGIEDARARIILAFFASLHRQIYGRSSLIDRAFKTTFPTFRPSRKLDLFFWSIRGVRNR